MPYKKDELNRSIVTPPNEDVSKETILKYVSEPSLLIKETIVNGIQKGESKQVIQARCKQIIVNALKDCPSNLKSDFLKSLVNRVNSDYFIHSHNTKVIVQGLKNNLKKEGVNPDIDLDNPLPFMFADVKFRGTDNQSINSKGLAIIEDYREKYRSELKMLSALPPKVAKDGRLLSARNLAEMTTRYEANKADTEEAIKSGNKLWWISSHADASPRCSPYQGKLYSTDKSLCGKLLVDGNRVEDMTLQEVEALHNGNSIINGYNCRHYLIEYQAKSSAPKSFNHEEIQKQYKIDQRQRTYENNIRQIKMEQRLASASHDTEQARKLSNRWHRLEKNYQSFSLKNHRAYYTWRTQVARFENVDKQSNQLNEETTI